MREEAREIRDTLTDIETWADKLKALAEEVPIREEHCSEMKGALPSLCTDAGAVPDVHTFTLFSPRTACLT